MSIIMANDSVHCPQYLTGALQYVPKRTRVRQYAYWSLLIINKCLLSLIKSLFLIVKNLLIARNSRKNFFFAKKRLPLIVVCQIFLIFAAFKTLPLKKF